ncbi:MAG: hypothetical protein WBD40_19590 [Tepidisphaeraceae bacterium]
MGQQEEGSFSVSQVAEAVGVCRDRFYELVSAGVFPPPAYDVRTRRPFYTATLRATCMAIRASGVGFDGQRVLFNRTKRSHKPAGKRPGTSTPAATTSPRQYASAHDMHERLARQLRLLGVQQVDAAAVEGAVRTCFPGGTAGVDDVVVLHRLRQHPWPTT